MEDVLLESYLRQGAFRDYTELRLQRNVSRSVSFRNGDLVGNRVSEAGGVCARVFRGGSCGFAASPMQTDEGIRAVLNSATENARFLDSRQKLGLPPFSPVAAAQHRDPYVHTAPVPQKQIIDFLRAVDAYVEAHCPKLLCRVTVAPCLYMEKSLVTSDGVFCHSYHPHSSLYVLLTAEDRDGAPQELGLTLGESGTFDRVFHRPEDLYEKIDTVYTRLMEKCDAVYAEAGYKDVILHPDLAGMLAHEAVGHTTEADFVLSGSVAGPNKDKQVASELVTLVDFAHTAFGKECAFPIYIDDEGTPAEDVTVIDHGILRGYMHNKDSARQLGAKPTGNARAFSFSDEPLIRMRNTAILPGKDKLEDMIAAVDDGYYFVDTGNGQADATGEFMFGVDCGYEIRHGKLGRAIKSTTISGVAFEMLKTVDMLSDDLSWVSCGMCGKKQPMPVSMGGPAIKCKINVGGR